MNAKDAKWSEWWRIYGADSEMAVKWSHLRDWCGKALDCGGKSQHLAVLSELVWIAGNDECERCTIFHICKMGCGDVMRGGGMVLFGAFLRGIRRNCGEIASRAVGCRPDGVQCEFSGEIV